MEDLHYLSLKEASIGMRDLKISPVAVVEACLKRIESLNNDTNAFITVLGDSALKEAAQAESEIRAGHWRGPLHGIPVGLKDMYDTEGIRTTAAFKHFKDRIPKADAAVVRSLKQAGAIIIGKMNMHELAMGTTSNISFFGPVRNPWNPEYIAGGSSGGSAAAVAAGMCFATVDTDAIGSCRLPASCCGVAGYKCTWGRIDNSGILAGEKADDVILKLATVGIMAREVADIASVVDCLTGSSVAGPFNNETAKPSIGIVTNYAASPDIRAVFEAAAKSFKEAGHLTQETTVPFTENPDMKNIERNRQSANDDLFGNVDVLILPTTAGEVLTAKVAGKNPQALSAQNTFFVNYYGLPAISVSCGFDANGLPVGLQIVGRQNQDDVVLQVAQAYQSVTRWHSMHPQR